MQITIDPFWKSLDIEDDIILIATLYDAYGKEENIGKIVVLDTPEAEKYFEESCSTASVKKVETITKFITKKILSILDSKRFPVKDEKREVNIYKVKINWPELDKYASVLHDTESRPPYGIQKQAIILKDLIIKVGQKLKSNEFEITEKLLGSYMAERLDYDTFIHYERPDYYIAFVKSVMRLQEIRFLKILDMRFDFNAWPTPTHAKGVFDDYVPTGVPASFYPAEHCHLLIEINNPELEIKNIEPDNNRNEQKFTSSTANKKANKALLPKEWELNEKEKEAHIKYKGQIRFTFKHNDSIEYKYFKYLWDHYAKKISYKNIYEFGSGLPYPKQGKRAAINSSITNSLKKTLDKLYADDLSQINIQVNMGYTLTIRG